LSGQDVKVISFIRDVAANVYGSTALSASTPSTATKLPPIGRTLVTRAPVDGRYLAGVKAAVVQANAVFSMPTVTLGNLLSLGFTHLLADCKPTQLALDQLNLTASSRLYVDCTSNGGFGAAAGDLTINAGTVVFDGGVAPSAVLALPNAHHVYVRGTGAADSIVLGGGTASFRMNTSGNVDGGGRCSSTRSSSKAALFLRTGDIKESAANNLLQLCKTTVFMLGGDTAACVPTYDATVQDAPAPTSTPCAGNTMGTGQLTQTGGNIDWTAPDRYDVMTLADGTPDPTMTAAWSDPNGPEDLALWSESGTNSSSTFNMSGGGVFNVRGVFMVPNADPFTIGGGSTMILTNAQFIASTIALNGNTTNLTMTVDPNAAVTLPELKVIGLVR
jgi:hypothetical protein